MPVEQRSLAPHKAEEALRKIESLVALTGDGLVTILRPADTTEHFILMCLVAQQLAFQIGRAAKKTMSVDELIAAGGLSQRIARQTIYNCTSSLSKAKIVQKKGNEFFVDERTELQFFATVLPQLLGRK